MSIRERFMQYVEPNAVTGCWEWSAGRSAGGYGRFTFEGKNRYAHRVSYVLEHGAIPDGLCIDHLCRNRACVNPQHLEAVSNAENMRRGIGFPGINTRKTHCRRGHALSGSNLLVWKNNGRRCLQCTRNRKCRM